MREQLKSLKVAINRILEPTGFRVARTERGEPAVAYPKYVEALSEMDAWMRLAVFRELPPCPGRPELLARLLGTQVSEAFHILAQMHTALRLDGDVCEFGIAQGATSALLANELRSTSRRLWLFDSFQGLPQPTDKDKLIDDIFNLGSMERYAGTMAIKAEEVTQRLNDISFPLARVNIVPGFIEQTSKSAALPGTVCFAYVDFDFYQPILIALHLLDSRMPVGGRIVVDDYGFFSSGAKTAVDEFVAASDGRFALELPPAFAGHFAMLTKRLA